MRTLRTRTIAARPALRCARRSYATAGHGHPAPSSDAPWAIGAIVVTVPLTWWILSSGSTDAHGHDSHSGHHNETESHEAEKASEDSEEEPKDAEEEEAPATQSSESQEEESGDESDQDVSLDTPESSDDESHVVEEDEKNVRKHVPDAKGGAKARIESKQSKKQGELSEDAANDDEKPEDVAAASKPAGGLNTQSGKQEGLSNTDTKHSIDIENRDDKSKKGDGSPETSKAKGTVDANAPVK